jgi:hypothetical protein
MSTPQQSFIAKKIKHTHQGWIQEFWIAGFLKANITTTPTNLEYKLGKYSCTVNSNAVLGHD